MKKKTKILFSLGMLGLMSGSILLSANVSANSSNSKQASIKEIGKVKEEQNNPIQFSTTYVYTESGGKTTLIY